MLGTLPTKYIKWVSKTLRARDFEDWAKLADEVLQDPVYRDRIEWEFAENILNGNTRSSITESPVSDLLEISERFGWNNEDKVGWSKIDFALLGTTKGGRIPRIGDFKNEIQKKFGVSVGMGSLKKDLRRKREARSSSVIAGSTVSNKKEVGGAWDGDLGLLGKESRVSVSENLGLKEPRKVSNLKKGFRVSVDSEEENGVRVTREERRERQRLKRGLQVGKLRMENRGKNKERERDKDYEAEDEDEDQRVEYHNPFPGREGLLKKVLRNRRIV
ncbi:hypothetical protein NE237_026187 [Protea cynaroides]|uniref:Uncharacterized protein n=1 Tax=Protea cynaroides TaxID=273540 RepID=A0A9Q0H3A7_9MAGN|nr:hypothetical protein NE237_026187 [Protea cynaroides]